METSSLCRHFGVCGGCVYQDMTYEQELHLKEAQVRALLSDYPDEIFLGLKPSPVISAYRNKMEFAFGDESKEGPLALGIRKKRNFYEVAVPDECTLIQDDFKQILLAVLDFFQNTAETFYHRKRHTGTLRHLILRRSTFNGELLVNLVTTGHLQTPLPLLADRIVALPLSGKISGILHTVNDSVSDTVINENLQVLYGNDYYYELLCGLNFRVSAFSFFQTNPAGAEVLYEIVKDFAGKGTLLYDLYCGTGTIAQILSPNAQKVVGVDLSEEAIIAATENAAVNHIENCEFIAGDVLHHLDTLRARDEKVDVVVLDPPRDGIHPKAMPKIVALQAPRLVYVSCKPASLARDMALLTAQGYKPAKIVGVDMFPRTAHVECVAELVKCL